MVRLTEHKKAIVVCIILIFIITTMVDVMLPKRTTEIKKNTVYMSGVYLEYPDKDDPRYYLEFKDDNTYVLMYDDSRRREENYNEDGDGSHPRIWIYFGKYEVKTNNYLIKPTESGMVGFKDTANVKKFIINSYGCRNYKNDKSIKGRIIFKTKKGHYILGVPNDSRSSYRRDTPYSMLYNKSDIKKLPSSVEEFRKQFKMDKKAEQDLLKRQSS